MTDTDPRASLEFVLGQMDMKLTNICREVGEIKDSLKCQDEDCEECREKLKKRIDDSVTDLAMECADQNTAIGADLAVLKKARNDGQAVDTFLNGTIAKTGMVVGILGGIVALVLKIWGWLTGAPFP